MPTEMIIEILKVAGYIILGGLALYLKAKETLKGKASAVIAEAEETYKDTTDMGGIKFEYAVFKLQSLIPIALRAFITRDMLENIVQTVFDSIEAYAKIQLDKIVDKVADGSGEMGE